MFIREQMGNEDAMSELYLAFAYVLAVRYRHAVNRREITDAAGLHTFGA